MWPIKAIDQKKLDYFDISSTHVKRSDFPCELRTNDKWNMLLSLHFTDVRNKNWVSYRTNLILSYKEDSDYLSFTRECKNKFIWG